MSQEYENLLSQLLDDSENFRNKDAATLASELELNDESKQMLEEAFAFIEQLSDGLNDLQNAKEQGMSRRAWMMRQLESHMDNHDYTDEEKSQVVSGISEQLDKTVEQNMTKEEEA